MKATLYVPYIDYDVENGFSSNIELSGQNYIDFLNNNLENPYIQYEQLKKSKENNYSYHTASITLLDINSQDETIDNLLKYYQTGEMFINQFYFDNIEQLEDIYDDFKIWSRESYEINNSQKLTDDMKIASLPTKEFKISFGENSNAILTNCKLVERFTNRRYAVLVEKIIFVN